MTSFEEIENSRAKAGITRKALYQTAGVNKETWRRIAQGSNLPNTRTLQKLKAALDALLAQRERSNG